MDSLSAFQLLPQHVVKLIVDHVAGSSRLRFDGVYTGPEEYKLLLMPLLWACHNFRALVHQRFCRMHQLTLENDRDRVEASIYSWPTRAGKFGYPTHHLAEELRVKLDIKSVYTGKALQLLSGAPYEGCAFPLVRKLVFDLTTYDANDDCDNICPLVTAANTTAFAQRVKQLAPAVSEIDVWSHGMVGNLFELRDAHALDLVRRLFGIVEKHTVITRGSKPLVTYMDLEPIRDLVHIDYKLYAYPNDIMPPIRRSARTLQFLDIGMDNTDVTSLVKDPDGGCYLEYPCLQTLNMDLFNDTVPSPKAAFIEIVPFPRLLRLGLLAPSPFSDDTLFRGNTSTLEYLKLKPDPETILILREYRVFTPTSHPNLKCVKICSPPPRIPNAFATVAEYMQFFLSIAPGASVREISELVKYNEDFSPALSMFKDHGCIQVLSLPDTPLALWEVIGLVKSLPLLSDLTTRPPNLGELPQGVSMTMLSGHVRATFAPMGRRLRRWHISPA
ncbi:hypothetical protein GGH94_001811 [Coemansia aciculifera]|uniref:Uncharacterized protein n=1 Tax=Coemansia aciculifera TaxID=417176 RepID=A0A9W8IK16_9FUNG|nr:hypothetical protein GGH94_001811 [Coemansia aciculifera]